MGQQDYDFVVVGSGAAGLVGAITAARSGLRSIIIEKSNQWGGTTALSGGVLWVSQNALARVAAPGDTAEMARSYLHGLLGADRTKRQVDKAEAFLAAAPEMARMLGDEGMRWIRDPDHPDYYPEVPGKAAGRTIESAPFDGKRLGARLKTMRNAELDLPAINSRLAATLTRAKSAPGPFLTGARIVIEHKIRKSCGQKPFGMGRALIASLMDIAMRLEIPIRLSTRLVELTVERGSVTGVVVESNGKREHLDAPAGVLLDAGGFAHNPGLRKQLQGFDENWSNASPDDQGDALVASMAIGAGTELTDDCWWMPSLQVGPQQFGLMLGLGALPGSIIVNGEGRRYMNEARSYMSTGKTMREAGAASGNHWLIMDSRFLKRYIFAELSQESIRESMLANGYLHRAETIAALAEKCGLDPTALEQTVDRFNGFARTGKDLDFQRGATAYDRHWADPRHRPNASLGEISRAPFWAALVRPGDLGTNGGIMTDSDARVLDTNEQPIPRLFAAGNGSGSPFGRTYPGAGATIGAAATFSYRAARSAAMRRSNRLPT